MENRRNLDLLTPPADLNKNFDEVYAAAKALNEPKLKELLAHPDYCIDPIHHLQTPAGKLAQQGLFSAAELLLKLGANSSFVAESAIRGGHLRFAEKTRKVYGANPGAIATYACFGGHFKYAEWLQESHGTPSWQLICGAAFNGNLQYALSLCPEPITPQLKIHLCQGLALGGHYKLLKELFSLYFPTELEQLNIQPILMLNLGMAGHIEIIEQWIEDDKLAEKIKAQLRDPIPYLHSLTHPILMGLLMGNYYDEAVAFIKKYHPELTIDFTEIFIASAAFRGHISEVKRLIPETKGYRYHKIQTIIARSAMLATNKKMFANWGDRPFEIETALSEHIQKSGHINFFKEMIYDQAQNYLKKTYLQLLGDWIIQGPAFANEKLTLHILSFINDHEFVKELAADLMSKRRELAEKRHYVMNGQLETGNIFPHRNTLTYDFSVVAKKAIKINTLMQKYFFDFDQACEFLFRQDVRNLLALIPHILSNKNLPPEIAPIIINQLCLFTDKETDSYDFLNKYNVFFYAKAPILNDLDKYIGSWWIKHRERATSLRDTIAAKKTGSEVQTLIAYQHGLFTGRQQGKNDPTKPKHEQKLVNNNFDDDYYRIMNKHRPKSI